MVVYVLMVKHTHYPLGVFSSQEKAWAVVIQRLANDERYSRWSIMDFEVLTFNVEG